MVFVWWETNTHGWEYRVRVFNGLIPRRATAARCNGVNGLRSVQISGCWLRTGRPPATWKPGNLHPPGQLDALPGANENFLPLVNPLFSTKVFFGFGVSARSRPEDPPGDVSTNVCRGVALPVFGGFWD